MKKLVAKLNYQVLLLGIFIVLLLIFNYLTEGIILQKRVLFGMTENVMEIGILALGMTFVIATGGIDLSVGYIMALGAIIMGLTYEKTGNMPLAVILCFVTGFVCGGLNGIIITKGHIPPLVTTLATFSLFTGIAKIITGTRIFSNFPKGMSFLVTHKLFGAVPYQFILFLFLSFIFWIIMDRTRYGRYLRGMGFNEQTVRFSGVNVDRVKTGVYIVAGLMSSMAAVVYLCRRPAAKPDIGININLETITAVVLGGTSIVGGVASIQGTVVSILVLSVLRKGLSLIGLGGDKYNFILGIILVICLISFSIINGQLKLFGTAKQNKA
jgi:ribose/xylose/arabinose/galactoside ABC-type transport system permease subunit